MLHWKLRIKKNVLPILQIKLLLKYDCNVATTYNKQGYLPIHVACMNNNWRALAVLMQHGLHGDHSDCNCINLKTRNKNQHTALELSTMTGYTKCVQIFMQKQKYIC